MVGREKRDPWKHRFSLVAVHVDGAAGELAPESFVLSKRVHHGSRHRDARFARANEIDTIDVIDRDASPSHYQCRIVGRPVEVCASCRVGVGERKHHIPEQGHKPLRTAALLHSGNPALRVSGSDDRMRLSVPYVESLSLRDEPREVYHRTTAIVSITRFAL